MNSNKLYELTGMDAGELAVMLALIERLSGGAAVVTEVMDDPSLASVGP
jgi:hypothetical protein